MFVLLGELFLALILFISHKKKRMKLVIITIMLKYQNQNTDITVLEGIKEYREYLVQNNKDKLQDFEAVN
ncbi:MAG: hypothetical protein CM15mP127_07940 [Gammaproteobacteria bacterium]|nr:MAG: hypothetical protein CM15mP127_07940 [Gammaproteobacteria bacterium]